tara:strand:+ start:343 stop:990 length:648 start_codon:yes stop_codon:yes gene_type:complete
MIKVKEIINQFFSEQLKKDLKFIRNEASLQHELALYIRNAFEKAGNTPKARVLLELPVQYLTKPLENISDVSQNKDKDDWIKKEIDIVVYDGKKNYVIELKFVRKGAGLPKQLYHAIEDVIFCEQMVAHKKADNFFAIFLTDHSNIIKGTNTNHIYSFFNKGSNLEKPSIKTFKISELENHPAFMKEDKKLELKEEYTIDWRDADQGYKYYIISD